MLRGRRGIGRALGVLLALSLVSGASAAEKRQLARRPAPVISAQEASAKLRRMYFAQDFQGGRWEGERLIARFPGSTELRAWFLMHQSRSWLANTSVNEAERMLAEHPQDPWSWFALAGTLQRDNDRGREALRTSEKALSLAREHPDFLWLRASILAAQETLSKSLEFIDRTRSKVANPAELLVVRAVALRREASRGEKPDPVLEKKALEAFAEARRIDPANVNARARAGELLLFSKRPAEAYALLREAIRLSPVSSPLYGLKWRAIQGLPDRKPEQKRAEIESDVRFLLQKRGDNPEILGGIADQYGELGLEDKQRRMEDRVLRLEPDGVQAEWVLVNRWRRQADRIGPEGKKDSKQQAVYRRMLRDFIRRPSHRAESLLGEAYMELFLSVAEDPKVSDDEIRRAGRRNGEA